MQRIRGGLTRAAAQRALLAAVALGTLLAAAGTAPAMPTPGTQPQALSAAAGYNTHLTRVPYLTDLVGLHVAVNFATDTSGTSGSIKYGAVGATGSCTPTKTVTASRTKITVGTVAEYQWTAQVNLPAAGTYCYRVYLGSTDLLASSPSPQFTSQVPVGSSAPFSFDVMGDWGQVDSTGTNVGEANLMAQIAASGARFMVTVGDNGYPNGNQLNYGDLKQTGANTSAIFGPQFWSVPGPTTPIFTAVGNHGVSGPAHTDITTWTQTTTVSTSGGRYQNDVYCCPNGSAKSNYGSEWYAFDAGNARFYVLDSAWGDTNGGSATPYADDALAHFAPGTPEYTWLQKDLQAHPTQLKFAFSHYPLYADNPTESSDTYLEGASNLEGLLGANGVQIVFNGHAHMYERNTPSAPGMPITYVTGGGGGTLEPVGPCHGYDAYGIGWSPTKLTGTACGAATPPSAAANVYHFLKVTVSGSTVTVAPTDSLGNTFDVQTYTFSVAPDTYLDTTPPAASTSTDATFTFHASGTPATYHCQLDSAPASVCTSPFDLTALSEGQHTFQVSATVAGQTDPTPATYTWTVDATAPTAPTGLTATADGPFQVDLGWTAAIDNTGVTGYRIYRDGTFSQAVGPVTSASDPVLGGSTHTYTVTAVDAAGNESPPSTPATITTPPPPTPVFADGFETGDLSAWTTTAGLTVQTTTVRTGTYAAEGNTTTGNTFAKKTLPATYPDGYARVAFDVRSQSAQINLLRVRDNSGVSIGYAYLTVNGTLGFHDDTTNSNIVSTLIPGPGWHALELRIAADTTPASATGTVQIWLDNALVTGLSTTTIDVGSAPIHAIQIGDVQTSRTYDVVFDDAAFGTSRLGPQPDADAPLEPTGLTAAATSAFSVQLAWDAGSGDTVGYDISRDGTLLATIGAGSSFTDDTVLAGSTYSYAVRAVDAAGNRSTPSATASVTLPAAAAPLYSNGFETGDLSGWTSTGGLTVESTSVRTGSFGAEGNTTNGATYAKKTLATSYDDGYTRVAYLAKSQASQLNLLRLRTSTGTSLGYVYLDASGRLALHVDAANISIVSTTVPGAGWHTVELHMVVSTGVVQVWLDGVGVDALALSGAALGGTPMGGFQIGETTSGRTYDVVFDDSAFSTSRIGVS